MSGSPHDHGPLAPPVVREVSDGVYAYIQPDGSWWINNTGFLVDPGGVISVDTCSTERRTRDYLAAIATVTDAPVRTVLNTHHHGDHTHGNFFFPGATIVGHELTREEVLAAPPMELYGAVWDAPDWGEFDIVPPFLTFTDRVTLYSGDLRCEVEHVGVAAHTTNDSVMWIPSRKVLFAGDLVFNGGTPFVLMGSVKGAISALEELELLGAETIVPGHGDPCGPEIFGTVLGYLRFVQETAVRARAAGLTPLEAARETDLGDYAALLDPERLAGNLHRAYAELDGARPGAPIDLVSALGDMVALNGGAPLTCYA
jgi:cyclase